MTAVAAALAFVTGSAFGSFANVVIYRFPRGQSIVSPRSACPSCGTPITAYDNLPIVSYLLLRGRCRHCQERISVRYPLVEIATGGLWAAAVLLLGLTPELPAFLGLVTALVILSAIDLEHHRLPNRILAVAGVAGAVLLSAAALFKGEYPALGTAALGVLAYGAPMLVIALIVPKGMGGGDVKFAAYLGGHLGWFGLGHVAVGAFVGFLIGAVGGVALMAVGRKGRKDPVPFGPFMALGALIAIPLGDEILKLWLG